MTEADFHDALRLLDSAQELLRGRTITDPDEIQRRIRQLTLEFNLLRVRMTQAPTASERN